MDLALEVLFFAIILIQEINHDGTLSEAKFTENRSK